MLKFLLLVNKQGHTRVSQYYEYLELEERTNLEAEITRKCLARSDDQVTNDIDLDVGSFSRFLAPCWLKGKHGKNCCKYGGKVGELVSNSSGNIGIMIRNICEFNTNYTKSEN